MHPAKASADLRCFSWPSWVRAARSTPWQKMFAIPVTMTAEADGSSLSLRSSRASTSSVIPDTPRLCFRPVEAEGHRMIWVKFGYDLRENKVCKRARGTFYHLRTIYRMRMSLYCRDMMVTLVSILSPIFFLRFLIDWMVLASLEAEEMSEPMLLSGKEQAGDMQVRKCTVY